MTRTTLLWMLLVMLMGQAGCMNKPRAEPLHSPYASRQVWAVAPLRNESGSTQANGLVMADHLARQLENATQVDVLSVNRVLTVMDSLGLTSLQSPGDAQQVMRLLGADYLVVGVITAYDPYDPPKLGMAIELFASPSQQVRESMNLRHLTGASTDREVTPPARDVGRPVSLASGFFDAADPQVRQRLQRYARDRSQRDGEKSSWRLYRINMNQYSEFVSYAMSWRLLQAEKHRLAPQPTTDGSSSPTP